MRLPTLSTLLCGMTDILDNAQTVISAPSRARVLHDALQSTIEKYEAEKVAHGETQRHLTAAIAERDEWQRLHAVVAKTVSTHKGRTIEAEAERDAIRTRVAELESGESGESGEPVAWSITFADDDVGFTNCAVVAAKYRAAGKPVAPLYAAPQPAAPAYGVEEERFVCWEGACMWLTDDDGEGARDTGTRAEVEARAKKIAGSKVMRLVDADAPVVDVDKIREVIADLGASYPRLLASESAHLLRAAIGEKA